MPAKRPSISSWLDEVLYAALILIAGLLIGNWFAESGIVKRFYFYQDKFAPAVMLACGHGFIQPVPEPEAITAFLALKLPALDCADIQRTGKSAAPDLFQAAHQYLLMTVAGIWKLKGVSWNNLNFIYGVALGLTGMAAYALCRTVMSRPLSFLCSGLMLLSPLQLFNLPHLRDYIKAPFFLTVIAVLAWQIRAERFSRGFLAWAAVAGALIGTGIGFRIDVLTLAPLYFFSLFAFLPEKLNANLKLKLACAFIFTTTLAACAWPVLSGFRSGGNTFHVLVLGLMGEFDGKLGLVPGFYSLGYHYLDMYVSTILNAYVGLNGYDGSFINYPSLHYEQVGAQYYKEVFHIFPADMLARFLGAAWQILHLPITAFVSFEDLYFFYDDFINPGLYQFLHLPGWDFLVVAVLVGAILSLLRYSLKLCLATVVILLFLVGYPFLQFSIRHYFFLQIVGLWLGGLVTQTLVNKATGVRFRNPSNPAELASWKHVTVQFGVFGIILPGLLFVGLRSYQSKQVLVMFERYAAAHSRPLDLERLDAGGKTTISPRQMLADSNADTTGTKPVQSEFLVAEFDSRRCGHDSIHVKYVYAFGSPIYDFSRSTSLGIDSKTRVVFPVYFHAGRFRFSGLEIPASESACLTDLRQITEPAKLSFPLAIEFSNHWRDQPRYREFGAY